MSLAVIFPGQEYWSGLPFLSPGNLPKPASPALEGGFFTPEPGEKPMEDAGWCQREGERCRWRWSLRLWESFSLSLITES